MAKLLNNVPMTEEWNNMKLLEDVENKIKEQYQVVYKKSAEDGKWHLYDMYNKDKSYNEDFIIMPIGSVCHGIQPVNQQTPFVNVLGSAKDPRPEGVSWIGLMRIVYDAYGKDKRLLESCCTDGNFYVTKETPNGIIWNVVRDENCNNGIVGGHVLLGKFITKYSNIGDTVYMLPICNSHNTSSFGGGGTGSGFFMVTKCDIWALVLDRFLQNEKVQRYLNYDDCNN